MAIIKPKLSSLVASQLPEFIREDYTKFVSFVEAYYEYLESQIITDFASISDIDTTLDSFVKYFKNELALNFPTTLVSDRFLLPKIKELYISKGSEASFNLLFKLLYNKDIQIKYPATQMLRVSDGKWIQPTSIFINIATGSPEDIVGRTVTIYSPDASIIKRIKVFVDSYADTVDVDVKEFFISNDYTGTFNDGDLINLNDFNGTVVSTTSSVIVLQAGKNFKVGQAYNTVGTGSGSVFRVESVDRNGGLKIIKFIDFGVGYNTSFSESILASATNQSGIIQSYFTISGTSPTFTSDIVDSVDQMSDSGTISLYDYATTSGTGDYVNGSYVGKTLQSFSNLSANKVIDPLDYAVVSIGLGTVAKYPGYYKNNDGFLNDTMYIQDSNYYQAFSYVIQIDELFDSYKSVIKNILHPSGTILIGEYIINLEFDAQPSTSKITII